jgi:hypothetical protein
MRWPQGVEMNHQLGRARAAPMAECSVLTASSKARISSCSVSLSRWESPIAASPWGAWLVGMIDQHARTGQILRANRTQHV